jgi:hypothetical protein
MQPNKIDPPEVWSFDNIFTTFIELNNQNIERIQSWPNDFHILEPAEYKEQLLHMSENVSYILHQYNIFARNSYNTGIFDMTLKGKKLFRSAKRIKEGINRSTPFNYESYDTFKKDYRSIEDYIKYVKTVSSDANRYTDDYLARWQMYDKLFHDRVRGK